MPPVQGFVQRLNQQLLLSGKAFRIAGANTYYLAYVTEKVQKAVLDLADALKLNTMRIWAFLDANAPGESDVYFQSRNPATQALELHDGPNGLERLDRAIAMAGERGFRLILALTNNWKDFGGMPQYVKWLGLPERHYFYRSGPARQAYRNWAEQLITRRNTVTGKLYRDEPAILAWELANEPRCETDDGKPLGDGVQTLLGWVDEMSRFVRGLDANHLIAVGDEGYFRHDFAGGNALFNGRYGVSCEELLGIGLVDFGTCHLYPHQMGGTQDPEAFGTKWIREHIAAAQRVNKPMVIEEYGIESADPRNRIFETWLKEVEALSGAGDLLWMLGLPKSQAQPFAPDAFVVADASEVPAVREHAMRISF
ncbi:MAG: glycoside hydrolase 5 family protein [Bryobacteraceae bacterium]